MSESDILSMKARHAHRDQWIEGAKKAILALEAEGLLMHSYDEYSETGCTKTCEMCAIVARAKEKGPSVQNGPSG